jgi:hypothetical protein
VVADADPSVFENAALLGDVRGLFEERYGEFELNCLFRTVAIMGAHSSFNLDAMPIPTPALCEAGVALLGSLTAIAGLPSALDERLRALSMQASSARDSGDIPACVEASAMARSDYFSYILKPSALGDLTGSSSDTMATLSR